MSVETLDQPIQAEQEATRERLTQEELDKAFADIAFILSLEGVLDEDDPIWAEMTASAEASPHPSQPDYQSAAADIFSLLNYSLKPIRIDTGSLPDPKDKRKKQRPRISNWDGDGFTSRSSYGSFAGDFAAFRNHIYEPAASTAPSVPSAPAAPKSDFTPAPSMAAEPLGPQLPDLSFNDRVRPQSRQPSEADLAAASRANEMYQRSLFKSGWRGGEATPDQQKAAKRDMLREYHPDLPTTSSGDIAAVQSFNSQNARPTTPGQSAPPSSAAPSA